MRVVRFVSEGEAGTNFLGRALAEAIPGGSVVGLYGTLGAGKTRLVQAIAEALGVPREQVVSPTFVLLQIYQGTKTVYHFDAYRIRSEAEFFDLGIDEYFSDPAALSLIEWAELVKSCLPPDRVEVHFDVTGPETRRVEIRLLGPDLDQAADCLQALLPH